MSFGRFVDYIAVNPRSPGEKKGGRGGSEVGRHFWWSQRKALRLEALREICVYGGPNERFRGPGPSQLARISGQTCPHNVDPSYSDQRKRRSDQRKEQKKSRERAQNRGQDRGRLSVLSQSYGWVPSPCGLSRRGHGNQRTRSCLGGSTVREFFRFHRSNLLAV